MYIINSMFTFGDLEEKAHSVRVISVSVAVKKMTEVK